MSTSTAELNTTDKPETKREDTMDTTTTEAETSTTSIDTGSNDMTAKHKNNSNMSNEETIAQAKEHLKKDQVLAAARLLNNVTKLPDSDLPFQEEVQQKADLLNQVITDLLANPDEGDFWTKGGESHSGHRDTAMYYNLSEADLQLKCRLETPIESSLLVPLLSVLIETDLYMTWLPRFTMPRIGVQQVNKLAQLGRTEQIIQFLSEVPWPFTARDVVLRTCACDDIDDIEQDPNTTGSIIISLISLEEGQQIHKSTVTNYETETDVVDVPSTPEGMKRAEFDGGILIRKCPPDHVCLQHSTIEYPPDEHLILVGFSMRIDGKISPLFPSYIINFVIQTAITQMWAMFLKVAEEIRDGSRPQHAAAIAAKRDEIYDWVDQRIEGMFHVLSTSNHESNKADDDETEDEFSDCVG